jgi:hypothetical protein
MVFLMLFSRLGTNRGPADFLGKEPIMSEIQTTTWNEVAASNTAAPPDGVPTTASRTQITNWGRETMAVLKRDWDRSHTTISSTGSADAYVLTYTVAPPAYANGLRFSFKANFANGGTATCNVNGLGAKTIKKNSSSGLAALASGDILTDNHVELEYDSAADALVMLNPLGAAPTAGTGIDVTGTAVSLDFLDLTSETSVAGSDEIAIYDASASAHRRMTRSDFVAGLGPTAGTGIGVSGTAVSLAPSGLTGVTPASDDYLVVADTSDSGNPKKVLVSDLPASIANGGLLRQLTQFTASGTYSKPAWLKFVIVEVVGGGGGSGGGGSPGTNTSGGAGGGGGGYSKKKIAVGTLSANETVTIGAGGSAGSSGGGGSGGSGGTSSFGSHCSATGGGGGPGVASSTTLLKIGGDGGAGSGGDINTRGHTGGYGYSTPGGTAGAGANGGGTVISGGIRGGQDAGVAGTANTGMGAGGGEGTSGPAAGAAGGSGLVMVWEYE